MSESGRYAEGDVLDAMLQAALDRSSIVATPERPNGARLWDLDRLAGAESRPERPRFST